MSDWTEYVKRFAQINGITYSCALSMPECRQGYHVYKERLTRKKVVKKVVTTQKDQELPSNQKIEDYMSKLRYKKQHRNVLSEMTNQYLKDYNQIVKADKELYKKIKYELKKLNIVYYPLQSVREWELGKKTIPQLKDDLKKLGITINGTKDVLIKKILSIEHIEPEDECVNWTHSEFLKKIYDLVDSSDNTKSLESIFKSIFYMNDFIGYKRENLTWSDLKDLQETKNSNQYYDLSTLYLIIRHQNNRLKIPSFNEHSGIEAKLNKIYSEIEKCKEDNKLKESKKSKVAEEPKPSKKILKSEKFSDADYKIVINSWDDIDEILFPIEIDQLPVGQLLLNAIRSVKGNYIFPFLLFYTPELRKLFELLYLHFEEEGIYKAFEIIYQGIVVLFDYLKQSGDISEDKEIVPFLNKGSGNTVYELLDQYSKELPMRIRTKIINSKEANKLKSVKIK